MCSKPIVRADKDKIACDTCKSMFHLACAKLTLNDLEFLKDRSWRCSPCNLSRRLSRSDSDPLIACKSAVGDPVSSGITIGSIEKILERFKDDIINNQKCMEATLTQKIEGNTSVIAELTRTIGRQQGLIDELKLENAALKKQVSLNSGKLDQLEQYSRRNIVEIHGVPPIEDEDCFETIKKIGGVIGVGIERSMIDISHRLARPLDKPVIVAKFVRRSDADFFLDRSYGKRDLSTTLLGLPDNRRIYINVSLTPFRKKMLSQLRTLQKSKIIHSVQVDRAGRLKVQKQERGKKIFVFSDDDFSAISG